MSNETQTATIMKKSGEFVAIGDLRISDEIALDEQGTVFGTVLAVSQECLIAGTETYQIIFPLNYGFSKYLESRDVAGAESTQGDDVEMEGDEGETGGADIGIRDSLIKLSKLASNAFPPVFLYNRFKGLKEDYDRIVSENSSNSNGDIANYSSGNIGRLSDLKPGDILVKEMGHSDIQSKTISVAQFLVNKTYGYKKSYTLTHAAIYIGKVNGKHAVIEAVDDGVAISPLREYSNFNHANYKDYNFHVLRCRHDYVVAKALDIAKELVKNPNELTERIDQRKFHYAHWRLYPNIADQVVSGKIEEDTKRYTPGSGEMTTEFAKKIRSSESVGLYCSELVAYCYHLACDEVYPAKERFFSGLKQDMVSPEHLYVLGRNDSANFKYVGRLPAGLLQE
jgi:hypothetical protein